MIVTGGHGDELGDLLFDGSDYVEIAGEDAAQVALGAGSFHVALYDALAALDPATLNGRAKVT